MILHAPQVEPHHKLWTDVAVVEGKRQDYVLHHPRNALLVVEVSETTLANDLGDKASLYAAAGITDYWVVNLLDEHLVVFREAVADPSQLYGHRYADRTVLALGDEITPLAFPHVTIAVADLLP